MVQPPPIHRAMMNRHHARRSNSGIAPKLEPGINLPPLHPPPPTSGHTHPAASPKARPTPPSHSGSPTGTTFGSQHVASPAGSVSENMAGQIRPPLKAQPPQVAALAGMAPATAATRQMQMAGTQSGPGQARVGAGVSAASFYPTPAFQNHIEQLGMRAVPSHFPSPTCPPEFGPNLSRENRAGIRRRRYDGRTRRDARYPERSWSVSRRRVWRRTPTNVALISGNICTTRKSAIAWPVRPGRSRTHPA